MSRENQNIYDDAIHPFFDAIHPFFDAIHPFCDAIHPFFDAISLCLSQKRMLLGGEEKKKTLKMALEV